METERDDVRELARQMAEIRYGPEDLLGRNDLGLLKDFDDFASQAEDRLRAFLAEHDRDTARRAFELQATTQGRMERTEAERDSALGELAGLREALGRIERDFPGNSRAALIASRALTDAPLAEKAGEVLEAVRRIQDRWFDAGETFGLEECADALNDICGKGKALRAELAKGGDDAG